MKKVTCSREKRPYSYDFPIIVITGTQLLIAHYWNWPLEGLF